MSADPNIPHVEATPSDADGPGRALVVDTATGATATADVPVAPVKPTFTIQEAEAYFHLKDGIRLGDLAEKLKMEAVAAIHTAESVALKLGRELVDHSGIGAARFLKLKAEPNSQG